MKRYISLIFLLMFILPLIACSTENYRGINGIDFTSEDEAGNDTDNGENGSISIVATIFAPYDFAREIAGEIAGDNIVMLLPPASESHSYEPSPQDIIKIRECDVFIYVGGKSDSWVDGILSSVDTENIKIVALMNCVTPVEEELTEGMQEDSHLHPEDQDDSHEHDDEHIYHTGSYEYDEHVWTSFENAKLIVREISAAICEADTVNKAVYEANAEAYIKKLDALDTAFKETIVNAKRKTIVFGDRFPFRYFADSYELSYFAAFPGCSSETEANAQTVAFLIDKINAENIPVVFHMELSNKKLAEIISEATGAKPLLLHSGHSISRDDFQNNITYLNLAENNLKALREALA